VTRSVNDDQALCEEVLVKAALEIIRERGAGALRMRDLADVLGVSPMAAYHYVANKDDLLRRVGEAIWSSVEIPTEAGTWHERLRALLLAEREVTKQFPGLYEATLYLYIVAKRAIEDLQLQLILDAGHPPAFAVPAFRALRSWINGNAFIEAALRDPRRRPPPEEWHKAQRLTFDRAAMPVMNADDYFVAGLDIVIAGMRATLDAAPV